MSDPKSLPYVFFRVATSEKLNTVFRVIIDPVTLILSSSAELRQVAETFDDPKELKVILLQLADEFDRVRRLMPTSQCVALDDVGRALPPPEIRGASQPRNRQVG